MNKFIDECRLEWKRLRVPGPVADEMAAELAADLEEAEAEGVSLDGVLGRGASDPRLFAADWAAERAVIPPPPVTARLRGRTLVQLAIAALIVVAAVGAVLVIFASPHVSVPVGVIRVPSPPADPTTISFAKREAVWVAKANGGVSITVTEPRASGVDIHKVGSILLIGGIAGAILTMPFWFWSSRRFDSARA